MGALKARWKGLALSAAVIVAVAGVTLGVTTLLGVTFGGSGSQTVEGADVQTGRDRLAICVQAVEFDDAGRITNGDPLVTDAAKSRIEAALTEVAKHEYWEFKGYDAAPPVVDTGCPSQPLVLREGVEWRDALPVGAIPGPHVTERSNYQTFMFVMRLEAIDHLLGGLTVRVAPQEMTCEGHVCGEATTAMYVTLEELDAPIFLVDVLEKGVGLKSRRN